jgi:hypothetical protein
VFEFLDLPKLLIMNLLKGYLVLLLCYLIASESIAQTDIHSCEYGELLASNDLKSGKMKLILNSGFIGADIWTRKMSYKALRQFIKELKDHSVEVEFRACIREGYEKCYNLFTMKKINEIYGVGTIEKITHGKKYLGIISTYSSSFD